MCGCAFSSRPSPLRAARSIIRAKPAVVNGVPRSLTKTKGDEGLSRCWRRSARSSSPCSGCTLGVPRLLRGREAGPWQAQPGAIADRTPRTLAGRAGTRSGLWWHRDARIGCFSEPLPSGPQPRTRSDTRAFGQLWNLRWLAPPRCPLVNP